MFLIPGYFQVTRNVTPGEAGALMVPSVFGNAIGALITGVLISKHGRYKWAIILAPISSLLCFSLLLTFWNGHTSIGEAFFVFPGGFATGVAYSALFVTLANGVEEKDLAVAASGLYLSGSVGAVSGLSAASAILQIGLQSSLHKALVEGGIPNGEEASIRRNQRRGRTNSVLDCSESTFGYVVCAGAKGQDSRVGGRCLRDQLPRFVLAVSIRGRGCLSRFHRHQGKAFTLDHFDGRATVKGFGQQDRLEHWITRVSALQVTVSLG